MDGQEQDKILAFDTLFTNNRIQKMKIIMPFFDAAWQKKIAIYIKFMELQYTISYFRSNAFSPFPQSTDTRRICRELLPYCTPAEKKQMEQMENLLSTMENYREMMEMFSMMQEIFPGGEGGINPDMMSGLFGGDVSQMFDMFRQMQNNESNTKNDS